MAQTFEEAGIGVLITPAGEPPVEWAAVLADVLVRRQRGDGSWVNPIVSMREDEPVVATSMALIALASVRDVLGQR